jgi:hypothetical protein
MSSKLLKYGALVMLVAQNAMAVIGMRFSRVTEGPMYVVSTAILATEVSGWVVSLPCRGCVCLPCCACLTCSASSVRRDVT